MEGFVKAMETYGADIVGVEDRFVGDMDLYEQCVKSFLQDESFHKLEEKIKENEVLESFKLAHTLKGVAANLGLNPLYESLVNLVEPLRVGDNNNALSNFNQIEEERERLETLLHKIS